MRLLNYTLLLAAFWMFAPFTVVAQDNDFIGDNQAVNRIIKLRSSAMQPMQPQLNRVAQQPTSRATTPVAGPPQIKYDEIGSTPVFQNRKPVVDSSRDFASPPKPTTQQITAPRVSPKSWQYAKPAAQTNSQTRKATADNRLKQSGSNMIETVLITPRAINVNQQAQMVVEMHNRGKETVDNVTLVATIPSHVKLVSSTPAPTKSEGQVHEFTVPRIGGSGSRIVTLNVVPNAKRTIDMTTRVRVENSLHSTVSVQQPELSLAISGPQQVNIGQKVKHELVVANIGDGTATDVRLDTLIPQQIKLINQDGKSFIRTIAPGKSVRVKFESVAMVPGETEIKVAADSVGCDQKSSSIKLNVYQPQLRVSAIGPKVNYVQRDGIYTIDLENIGVVDVTDAKVSLQIPQGMKVTTISRQADVDATEGMLTWTFDRIDAKATEKIQLKATAVEPGQQVCKMTVTSKETMVKEMMLSTQVITRADLSVQIKNMTGPVQVGARAQFLVTVENNGSQRANDINVQIVLPESLMPIKDENNAGTHGTLAFSEPMVAAGQKVTFKFEAVGVAHGEHVVRSVLETDESTRKVIAEDTVFVYKVDETRVSESTTPVVPR